MILAIRGWMKHFKEKFRIVVVGDVEEVDLPEVSGECLEIVILPHECQTVSYTHPNDEKYTKILSGISPLQQLSYEGESLYDKTPIGSTAIIPVKGTLIKYGTFCSYGADEIAEQIRSAALHKNISSLVLDIDSGGGACDAVAPICSAIEDVRKAGKAVVASCDLAASAASVSYTHLDVYKRQRDSQSRC